MTRRVIISFLGLVLLSVQAMSQVTVDSTRSGTTEIRNARVRLVLRSGRDGVTEEYYGRGKNGWVMLLRSGHPLRGDAELQCDGKTITEHFRTIDELGGSEEAATLVLGLLLERHRLKKTIRLEGNDPFFHVEVRDEMGGIHECSSLTSAYSFVAPAGSPGRAPDFVWTPQLRPEPMDVIADHTFRAPALMMQTGSGFAAMIPDVDLIQPWRAVQTAADVRVDSGGVPLLCYGIMNWRTRSHVFYTYSPAMTSLLENTTLVYGYFLYLDAEAVPRQGYRAIVRFHWDRWGRQGILRSSGPQSEPFAVYQRKAWRDYLPQIAVESTYGGKPVTLLTQGRLAWSNRLPRAADTDCWFNVWFNSLRTAYGVYRYGQDANDIALQKQATGVLTLALSAPRRNGIAPSIFYLDSAGGHWVNDQGWGGIDGGRNYALFHNAWTSCWLLEWADLLPDRQPEITRAVREFADFCLARQLPSGVIPSWYDPVSLEPVATFREENAETAGASLLLSEVYRRTGDAEYLHGAERAMEYITREILPRQKWFDFETFFSCSRKPVGFYDAFSGQFPQNTLSMQQAAEACLSLYRATGESRYLEEGRAILDYLCLYQQVWSAPWLSRQLFGGFGVQNTDGEWSDARQGYFAVTLMKFYEATGEREYFERSVAALRAMFSLFESSTSPRTAENYAHSALDRPGGVTGIHWGTGSSVVSCQIIRGKYGDAYIDLAGGWGCGIDGCRVTGVNRQADTIRVDLADNLNTPRTIRLRFGRGKAGSSVLVFNGKVLGTYSLQQLEEGIDVTI